MKRNFLIFSCFFIVSFFTFHLYNQVSQTGERSDTFFLSQNKSAMTVDDYFLEAVSYWPKQEKKADAQTTSIFAGVVPHHLPASPMIAHFFSQLSMQTVDTIFIFAPNHEEIGDCKVITTSQVKQLLFTSDQMVCADDSVVQKEHAVTILYPYIDYYLVTPTIVPVVLSNYLSLQEVTALVEIVSQKKGANDLIVSSIDFSHYLSYEQAQKKDAETLQLIKEKKYEQLLALSHEHLDSPESLIVLMKLLEKEEKELYLNSTFQVIAHENFVTQTNDVTQPSTSYFEIIWHILKK